MDEKKKSKVTLEQGDIHAFTAANIVLVDDIAGVYTLYDGEEIIYFGSSEDSIRTKLGQHINGDEGECTQGATHFSYEETPKEAKDKEAFLIIMYKARHNGKRPRCNDKDA